MELAPREIIVMDVWFPSKTMVTTSTKLTSKKYIAQYSETTMTELFKLTGFATQLFLHDIIEASISLA